jgi:hypothetical protein
MLVVMEMPSSEDIYERHKQPNDCSDSQLLLTDSTQQSWKMTEQRTELVDNLIHQISF